MKLSNLSACLSLTCIAQEHDAPYFSRLLLWLGLVWFSSVPVCREHSKWQPDMHHIFSTLTIQHPELDSDD